MTHRLSLSLLLMAAIFLLPSCVSKKEFIALQTELDAANKDLGRMGESLNDYMNRLSACEDEKRQLRSRVQSAESSLQIREEQVNDLKDLIADLRTQRDAQLNQVDDLTTLSQSASDNIKETLSQLQNKDKYIQMLQAAKTRADSINLALAVNLKGVLSDGIEDEDVEVKVDKTVVFVNLSDKMLYKSGSAEITSRADEVLGKIAKIIKSRPGLEVMVEGYTDNQPINTACIKDNWDLSVKRATSVVRALQVNHNIDPNRLIAAGRGEYNTLADNATAEGRAMNRRTRIIILPKLDQFYDLLNPNNVPE
ncbi:OmpA family protein [Phaeodactylibacter luteus]|uniref:OmpA family protein n=1 Tax=Phaeodactylibacter luteus TaxID=1564516 RepID=A0A5C6RLS2_9BACT|nr:OmpA family protein [Phaeodactylibacter luteus]TXB62859.1 OmpA family protein [Phaeodactylibacter luteus]